MSADLSPAFIDCLKAVVGAENVLTDPAERWVYGYDNSRRHHPPDAVAFAIAHRQVVEIVRLCNEYDVPLVPRGRGTGTTGGSIPIHAGLVLSLERMDRIINMDRANRLMVVEPGVTNQAIQDQAGAHGFFWPPDPSSAAACSVGGNLAFNSAGPRAVKYGTCRENVLGLRAVTGAGVEIRTGVITTKGVVGYDLTRLIIGSEGTLAVITEAALKLTPQPECKRTLQAVYTTVHAATAAVVRIMNQPNTPCTLEFIDGNAIATIREHTAVEIPDGTGAMLIIEVDGSRAAVDAAMNVVTAAASGKGLVKLKTAANANEVAAIWTTRKALSPALRKIAPNKLNEDVVVPVSHIPELIEGLDRLSREFNIPIVNFGHAGNGNIHVNLLYDAKDPQQKDNIRPCLDRVFALVLQLGGTLSGEHGVGIEKRDYVKQEIDPPTLDMMRRIKKQFDPKDILNPGKIFPKESAV